MDFPVLFKSEEDLNGKIENFQTFISFSQFIKNKEENQEENQEEKKILFYPSMAQQRLSFVLNILNRFDYEDILDIGCGSGYLIQFLSQHYLKSSRIYGIDKNLNSLRQANNLLKLNIPWKFNQTYFKKFI